MTYPLIGNYGRLADDDQSLQPWLRALVVANATAAVLDDARQLASLLRDNAIPAIAGVDTRALARHLRANGSLRGVVTQPGQTDPDAAVAAARAVTRWEDQDFVSQVSPPAVTDYPVRRRRVPAHRHRRPGTQEQYRPGDALPRRRRPGAAAHGGGGRCPRPRRSTASSCRRAPATRPGWRPRSALARAIIDDGRPLLGICLGHQIVARAAGAETTRLRFGHHGANHPVHDRRARPRPGDGAEPRSPGRRRLAPGGIRLLGQPGQPQRWVGGGAASPRQADRDGPVPPGGRARPTRRAGGLRPVRGRRHRRKGPAMTRSSPYTTLSSPHTNVDRLGRDLTAEAGGVRSSRARITMPGKVQMPAATAIPRRARARLVSGRKPAGRTPAHGTPS